MTEPVRLVIWDLDETFWHGTLTEGGITLRTDSIEIVKELARRGIISSICSKNDMEQVKEILVGAGVWDYFILPSINWESKGARIAALIEAVQLRPSSAMFIDDNPINLEEARHFVPDLQTQSHTFIPNMLSHPTFGGKDDSGLSRLQQYRQLEKRKIDADAANRNVSDFLRRSNIRVRFDFEVIDNLDRAIELINRTNQLNFTKLRLPEALPEARAQLRATLSSHEVRVALIGVSDNYGDHGWCGIYVLHNNGRLLHFAFSCRILGMQVETWLYNKLGRPTLDVRGAVLVDVKREGGDINWIEVDEESKSAHRSSPALLKRFVARGGCDLMPVAHYMGVISEQVIGEFNEHRIGMDIRIDHSSFLHAAFRGSMSDASLGSAARLGFLKRDFESAAHLPSHHPEVWLFSFWTDAAYVLYRHKAHGFSVPFSLAGYHTRDARQANTQKLRASGVNEQILSALNELKSSYEYLGLVGEPEFKSALQATFSAADQDVHIFILGANEYFVDSEGVGHIMNMTRRQNAWASEVISGYDNVMLLNIRDFVNAESEVHEPYHFDRLVYYRLFEFIKSRVARQDFSPPASAWAIHMSPDLDAALEETQTTEELSRTAAFLMADGKHDHALRFARKSIDIDANNPGHRLIYTQAVMKSGAGSQREDIRNIIESHEFLSKTALDNLAASQAGADLLAEAAIALADAARAAPSAFHYRHRLANIFDALGRLQEAFDVFESCFDDGDRNPHMMAHMARLLIRLSRLDEARLFLDKCFSIDPEFSPFRAALASIETAKRQSRPELVAHIRT